MKEGQAFDEANGIDLACQFIGFVRSGDNGTGFGPFIEVFSMKGFGECGTVFCPVAEVGGSGDHQTGQITVIKVQGRRYSGQQSSNEYSHPLKIGA